MFAMFHAQQKKLHAYVLLLLSKYVLKLSINMHYVE